MEAFQWFVAVYCPVAGLLIIFLVGANREAKIKLDGAEEHRKAYMANNTALWQENQRLHDHIRNNLRPGFAEQVTAKVPAKRAKIGMGKK